MAAKTIKQTKMSLEDNDAGSVSSASIEMEAQNQEEFAQVRAFSRLSKSAYTEMIEKDQVITKKIKLSDRKTQATEAG